MAKLTTDSRSSRNENHSPVARGYKSHEHSRKFAEKRRRSASSSSSSSSIALRKQRTYYHKRTYSPSGPSHRVHSSKPSSASPNNSGRDLRRQAISSQNSRQRRQSPLRRPSLDTHERKHINRSPPENAKPSKYHVPSKSHQDSKSTRLSKRKSSRSRTLSPRPFVNKEKIVRDPSPSQKHRNFYQQRSYSRSDSSASSVDAKREETVVSRQRKYTTSSPSRRAHPSLPHSVRSPRHLHKQQISLSPAPPSRYEQKPSPQIEDITNDKKMTDSLSSRPAASPSVSALLDAAKAEPLGFKQIQKVRQHMVEERLGYTNESNPFGDSTLTQPFIWKKKNILLKATGELKKPTVKSLLESTEKKVGEIEAVKKRREERELEESLLEEQRQLMAREKEQEHFEEWVEKEEQFLRDQAVKKTDLHIDQGRERAIDVLMKGINIIKGKTYPSYTSVMEILPHEIFEDLSVETMESAMDDILLFSKNESSEAIKEFWLCLHSIGKEKVAKARRKEEEMKALETSRFVAPYRDSDANIPLSVVKDIEAFLCEKSPEELRGLGLQVQQKLSNVTEDVDPTYWEAIQAKLPYFLARAVVMDMRAQWMQRIEEIKKNISPFPLATESTPSPRDALLDALLLPDKEYTAVVNSTKSLEGEVLEEGDERLEECFSPELEPFDEDSLLPDLSGSCSPPLHPFEELKNAELVDPVEDRREREELRLALIKRERQKRKRLLLNEGKNLQASLDEFSSQNVDEDMVDPAHRTTTYDDFVRKETKNPTADEEIMSSNVEQQLQKHYDWEDKYRPRKPRYFNRVKTGYEWNKYNQTHYDHDNPPPKAVQGYKFNIFYPDLIDRTKTPTWHLQPSDTDDTVIIRFHAGPPYEDVAFKIINREWSLDRIRGFRNTFEKGILQLHFSFKRFRYRR